MRERLRRGRKQPSQPPAAGDDFEHGFLHDSFQDSIPGLDDEVGKPGRLRRLGSGAGPALKGAGARVKNGVVATGNALADGAIITGDAISSAGHAISDRWFAMPILLRQRLAAGGLAAASAALIWFVIVPVAPCWVPAGDRCAPGNDAIDLVPADAVAYLHINLDPETDQGEAAVDLSRRIPDLIRAVTGGRDEAGVVSAGIVEGLIGRRIDYRADVLPWSRGEIAIALLGSGASVEPVLIVEVEDRGGAEEFATGFGDGEESEYEGTTLTERSEATTAISGEFLLVGESEAVRAVVDVVRGESGSLGAASEPGDLLESLPPDRLAEAYLAPEAAGILLSGSAQPFDTFVNADASTGLAASVSIENGSVDLAVRSRLDPEKADFDPSVFAALPEFEPALDEELAGDAFAYLGLGNPSASLAELLERARVDAPGLVEGFEALAASLEQEGVDFERDLLGLLDGEVALSVEPRSEDEAGAMTPGVSGAVPIPYAGLLAEGVDPDRASAILARLQRPLSGVVDPADGTAAPQGEATEINGVEAQILKLSQTVELTYGFIDHRLAIATDADAIRRLSSGLDPLSEGESYERATEDLPDEISLLLYFDLKGVIEQLEAAGLATDTDYGRYAQDLRALEVAALAVSGGERAIETDLRVLVGERRAAETDPVPVEPEPSE